MNANTTETAVITAAALATPAETLAILAQWMSPSTYGNGLNLTNAQYRYVASYGDGFGRMTLDQMDELDITFDWSHIRDSSDGALREMRIALGRVAFNLVTF